MSTVLGLWNVASNLKERLKKTIDWYIRSKTQLEVEVEPSFLLGTTRSNRLTSQIR